MESISRNLNRPKRQISSAMGAGGLTAMISLRPWCGSLVLELLAVVPFLAAIPALFHEPAHSSLPHAREPAALDDALGASELLPMVAILPFMLYQLAAFGTLHFVVPKWVNWIINTGILCLILAACVAYSGGRVHAGKEVQRSPGHRHGDYRVLWRAQAEADAGEVRRALPAEGSEDESSS